MAQETPTENTVPSQSSDDNSEAQQQRVAIALIVTVLIGLLALAAFVSMGASAVGLRMPGWLISLLLPGLCAAIIGGIGYFFWRRGLATHAKELMAEDDIRD